VIVHRPGGLARVEADLAPAGRLFSEAGARRAAAAATTQGMKATVTATTVRTGRALIERAEDFAAALLSILADPTSLRAPERNAPAAPPGPGEHPRVRALLGALAACAGDEESLLGVLRDLLGDRELRERAEQWAARADQAAGRDAPP
jgi:hypothetical protein